MSIPEKIETIRQLLENQFNGRVTARAAMHNDRLIAFTLHLKYLNYKFSYLVDEEAIEMSECTQIANELIPIFETLIWELIRR